MKKFLTALTAILAVVVMAFALTACSDKAGSIKKAFEKEGFEVSVVKAEDSEVLKGILNDEQEKDISKYEVISCAKKSALGIPEQSATVIKFPSKDTIIEVVGQSGYDTAVEKGYVNGNCVLFLPFGKDVVNIFKKA